MYNVNEHFKTVKNLLRKILPQSGFESPILPGQASSQLDHRDIW